VPRPLSSTDPGVWPPTVHSGRGFFGRCLQLAPLGRRVGPLAPKSCEGRIDFAAGALRTCSLMARAAACASLDVASAFIGLAGLSSTAARLAPGTSSRNSSSRFAANSVLRGVFWAGLPAHSYTFRPLLLARCAGPEKQIIYSFVVLDSFSNLRAMSRAGTRQV
jgi:hypothetical protein